MFFGKIESIKRKNIKLNYEHFNNIFKEKLYKKEKNLKINEEVIKKGMDNNKFMKEK